MSDHEQAALADIILAELGADELPPLQEAAARKERLEQEEDAAQLAYQACRREVAALQAHVKQLALQETRAQTDEAMGLLATQATEAATTLRRMQAELTALDEARRQVNKEMFAAQHAYWRLSEMASAVYHRLRRAVRSARNPAVRAQVRRQWAEEVETHFRDLAPLVGDEEAQRCQDPQYHPAWLRR